MERRVLEIELRVRLVDLGSLGQHLVMERHHHLEQASCTSCGLGVPDLTLHRSECTPLTIRAFRRVESQLEATEFGGVACHCSSAVCFDQLDSVGPVTGLAVSVVEGPSLARRHRRVDTLRSSVRTRADSVDNAVNVVAVTLGVFESLECDHTDAFTEHCAVGRVRERPDVFGLRQCRRLRETHVHEDVVHGVNAAGDHQVAITEVQLVDTHRDGRERRGTRGVGDTVGAAQVEAVGDPTGDHVAEQARERALGPFGV